MNAIALPAPIQALSIRAKAFALATTALVGWNVTASSVVLYGVHRPATFGIPFAEWGIAALYWHSTFGEKWVRYGAIVATAAIGAVIASVIFRLLKGTQQALYGEARFAAPREIAAAGFRDKHGLLIGQTKGAPSMFARRNPFGDLLRLSGQTHTAFIIPTGGRKTTAVAIPNALAWHGSTLVLDMKGEIFASTAGHRAKQGDTVIKFDFLGESGQTHRWNPFAYVRRNTEHTTIDIVRIAQRFFPDNGSSDPFWMDAPRMAFTGIASFVAEGDDRPFTLGEVARIFANPNKAGMISRTIRERSAAGKPYRAATWDYINSYLGGSENTVASITQTVMSRLQLWLDPRVDAATAENDFDLSQLRQERHAVYVCNKREDLALLEPLMGLFWQQVIDLNCRTTPEEDSSVQFQVLAIMDEFANLGHMRILAQSFSLIRGYGFRIAVFLQSPNQLTRVYGSFMADEILDNCHTKVWASVDDPSALNRLEARIGFKTVRSTSKSRPAALLAPRGNGGSNSESSQRRAVLLPQEIAELDEDQLLVVKKGLRVFIANRINLFDDPRFNTLRCDPPAVPRLDVVQATYIPPPAPEPAKPGKPAKKAKPADPIVVAATDGDEPMVKTPPLSQLFGRAYDVDLSDLGVADAGALVDEMIRSIPTTKAARP